LGTQLAHSSSYHPQSNGQTEIVNKCLEGYLCCFVYDKKTQWFKWLPLAEWWYNTSFHTATKMTPFMALYGYHPPSVGHYNCLLIKTIKCYINFQPREVSLFQRQSHTVYAQSQKQSKVVVKVTLISPCIEQTEVLL
jgi:hypothetical protein